MAILSRFKSKIRYLYLISRRKNSFLDKRQRFVIQTLLLTAGLLITQLIWQDVRFVMVIILGLVSYILTAWSLTEDVKGVEWYMLFILPVFFTLSVSLFYFLLPARWFIRIIILTIFSVGTYAVLLVENIYNVAVDRSIQLLRAAHSIGLLLTLIVIFLSSNIVFSLRLPFYFNFLLVSLFAFILSLQSLWSVNLDPVISRKILRYCLMVGLAVGELALVLSFWPIENATYSLLITCTYYVLIGILQLNLLEKLFYQSLKEYISVFIVIILLSIFVTRWGGR